MQKKLIAIAIAAAMVPAAAMADSSNVTLYGVANASFDSVENGGANDVRASKVSSNSSRLGLKGTEDLGGGLKAVWQIEQTISIDGHNNSGTTTDSLATRNTFLGLAGDSWGQVTLGRNDTPYKTSTRAMDVFGDGIADNRSLMGGNATNSTNGFDQRFTDTIRYDSPNFNGFTVAAAYTVSSERNTATAPTGTGDIKGKAVSLSANYTTGPFAAVAAYQKNTFGSMSGAVNAVSGALTDEDAWKIGGSYKTSQFGVNAVYEKTEDSLGSAANGKGHKAFYLSGTFNATANDTLKLAYAKAKELQDGSAANTGAKQWSVGVDHSLSKRTAVYALYTKLDNESSANYALSSSGVTTGFAAAAGVGSDPKAFSLGMKHVF